MYSSETKYLLKHYGFELSCKLPTSPISLRKFCKNFPIQYNRLRLDKNTCGIFVRSEKGNFITINSAHPYTRRRFSLGHEFGHFYLGHDSDISQMNDQNRENEVQANRFSASLLMPDELFYDVQKDKQSIQEIANWFRVSPISVAVRCMQFGLRQFEAEIVKSDYYLFVEEAAAANDL